MKKVLCIRVSEIAHEKLMALVKLHGTQTEAIAFAIESLWRKEVENKK